ncbi:MAG: nucleotidyltransferase family protein [Pseudomonadota bacterium]
MKAMILAAGRGERMRPLTDTTPKPLLEVGGKALVVWIIEALVANGFRELVINVSHLGAQIENALGSGQQWNASIQYSREAEPLEAAGGIATALALLGSAPFIVVNADIYTDFDFARLRDVVLPHGPTKAHLVLVDNPTHHPDGDFALKGNTLSNAKLERYTFSGIGAYQPALFHGIAPHTKAGLAALLRPQIDAGCVSGEYHSGHWSDVGTTERLAQVDAMLRRESSARR